TGIFGDLSQLLRGVGTEPPDSTWKWQPREGRIGRRGRRRWMPPVALPSNHDQEESGHTMSSLVLAIAAVTGLAAQPGNDLPRVLFFANPMRSDNDVIRRSRPERLSVAERQFAELSRGVFDVTITQDGAEVSREKLAGYRAVVFFTAINPPGVDKDGL